MGTGRNFRLADFFATSRPPGIPHLRHFDMSTASAVAAKKDMKALSLSSTDEDIQTASSILHNGGLVAFPTETVYGLGANALNADAVSRIFKVKGRPLTDPLIVHVPNVERATQLLNLKPKEKEIFRHLADTFWPGPLTIVGKANERIPSLVTAGTGSVGLRCPNHELARKLLLASGLPIAAPSANRFGHVSPTRAQHVLDDLGDSDIAVLNGDVEVDCSIGIESTVLKIDTDAEVLHIFRRGGTSEEALRAAMKELGSSFEVVVFAKVVEDKNQEHSGGLEAPGQLLTHYAPDVNTSIVSIVKSGDVDAQSATAVTDLRLSDCVIVDFGGQLKCLNQSSMAYRDLSPNGDVEVAASGVFATLRWTETVEGAKQVLLADIAANDSSHEHKLALLDRLFRASSGSRLVINVETNTLYHSRN